MKKASLVSIGQELLSGQRADSNTAYLTGKLQALGIPVVGRYTVGDDVEAIVRAFRVGMEQADIVISTGGLGPTGDDLTREALAKLLGVELQFRAELLDEIKAFFERRNLAMPDSNTVQACIPAGTEAIRNELGTACGVFAEHRGKLLFALPGVPAEMERMFEETVLGRVRAAVGQQAVAVGKLRCFGAGESAIVEVLGPLMDRNRNPLIGITAEAGLITLTISAAGSSVRQAEEMVLADEQLLRVKLGDIVFGSGDQALAEVVGAELARRKKTLAVAESCTGGLLAKLITDVPGASAYFQCGWVTYSNRSKQVQLGVSAELLQEYGAVSEEVAQAMASGARKAAGTDFSVAITGIAGPTGATEQKPIGLVYICVDSASRCESKRYVLGGERGAIRLRAALRALNMLRAALKLPD